MKFDSIRAWLLAEASTHGVDLAQLVGSLAWPITTMLLVFGLIFVFRKPVNAVMDTMANRGIYLEFNGLKLQFEKLAQDLVKVAQESTELTSQPKKPEDNSDDLWDSDPQRNKWGGASENLEKQIRVRAGKIRPLSADPDYFWVPLVVESTDPKKPLREGMNVTFHLHPTFDPDRVTVAVRHGKATKTLLANGCFTVGVENEIAPLEIDLCANNIDAPKEFKED